MRPKAHRVGIRRAPGRKVIDVSQRSTSEVSPEDGHEEVGNHRAAVLEMAKSTDACLRELAKRGGIDDVFGRLEEETE